MVSERRSKQTRCSNSLASIQNLNGSRRRRPTGTGTLGSGFPTKNAAAPEIIILLSISPRGVGDPTLLVWGHRKLNGPIPRDFGHCRTRWRLECAHRASLSSSAAQSPPKMTAASLLRACQHRPQAEAATNSRVKKARVTLVIARYIMICHLGKPS